MERGAARDKVIRVVNLAGKELRGLDRAELRESAIKLVQNQGWIGKSFHNDDTGWDIFVRRKSLSHAFINRQAAAIQAIAVLPELIQTALYGALNRMIHPTRASSGSIISLGR